MAFRSVSRHMCLIDALDARWYPDLRKGTTPNGERMAPRCAAPQKEAKTMRTILRVAFSMGMVLFVLLGRALAQQPMGSMMSGSMPMMGWPMMLFMGLGLDLPLFKEEP